MKKAIIKKVMNMILMDSLIVIKIQKVSFLTMEFMSHVIQHVKNVRNMEMKMIINVLSANQDMNLKMIQ